MQQGGRVPCFVVLALAGFASCAVVPSGELYAFGRIGVDSEPHFLNETESIATFLQNTTHKFRAASAGPNVAAVINTEGVARRFDETTNTSKLEIPVSDPEGYQFCQVCRGALHTVAVTCDGRTFTWGGRSRFSDPDGKIPTKVEPVLLDLERVIQVACGENHTLLLTESRKVHALGQIAGGRLGVPELDEADVRTNVPVLVSALSPSELDDEDQVCFVAAGGASSFAITKLGQMYSWGSNAAGQLALNSTETTVSSPSRVPNDSGFFACEVAVSQEFVLGYDDKGDVWTWGSGSQTPARFGSAPDMIAFFSTLKTRVTMVAAGQFHLAFLTDDKKVYTLGYNRFGQLGVRLNVAQPLEVPEGGAEPDSPIWTLTPREVEFLSDKNIGSIFAGGNFTLALSNVLTNHNCPCARGGRQPTVFPALTQLPEGEVRTRPQQPAQVPSDLFAPVGPFNKLKSANAAMPGEVLAVPPRKIYHFTPTQMHNTAKGSVHPMPELPERLAVFKFYPPDSNEARAFDGGVEKGIGSLFGRDLTSDGYFYGDYDSEVASATYERKPVMQPTINQNQDMPEPQHNADMTTARAVEAVPSSLFSLSLQDTKAPKDAGDKLMQQAVYDSIRELRGGLPPVDFSRALVDAQDNEPDMVKMDTPGAFVPLN